MTDYRIDYDGFVIVPPIGLPIDNVADCAEHIRRTYGLMAWVESIGSHIWCKVKGKHGTASAETLPEMCRLLNRLERSNGVPKADPAE